MTNKESFLNISGDLGLMSHFFNSYDIDAALEDKNELAGAFGFVAKVMQSDETQGKSSIKVSDTARKFYIKEANRIFAKNDVIYDWNDDSESEISGQSWA